MAFAFKVVAFTGANIKAIAFCAEVIVFTGVIRIGFTGAPADKDIGDIKAITEGDIGILPGKEDQAVGIGFDCILNRNFIIKGKKITPVGAGQ